MPSLFGPLLKGFAVFLLTNLLVSHWNESLYIYSSDILDIELPTGLTHSVTCRSPVHCCWNIEKFFAVCCWIFTERPSAISPAFPQLSIKSITSRPQRGWVVCGIVHKAACKNQSEDIGDIDRISRPTRRRRILKEEQETKGRETAANLLIALCPVAIIPVPVPVPVPCRARDEVLFLVFLLLLRWNSRPGRLCARFSFGYEPKTFAVCQYKSNYRKCGLDVILANEQLRLLQVPTPTNWNKLS